MIKKTISFSWRGALVFIGLSLCFTITMDNAFAAEIVNTKKSKELLFELNKKIPHSKFGINQKADLILSNQNGLRLINKTIDKNSLSHLRYKQTFKGIPVWGEHIIATQNKSGKVIKVRGNKLNNLERDLGVFFDYILKRTTKYTKKNVLEKMKMNYIEENKSISDNWQFDYESSELVIYNHNGIARLCYEVSFFTDTPDSEKSHPAMPHYFVDAFTQKVLFKYEGLNFAYANGPGGNQKTGRYMYGTDYPSFEVRESNGKCHMENAYVRTVDLNHGMIGIKTTPHSFDCPTNTYKEINGAFSPLNDAHAAGTAVYNMYDEWFNDTPSKKVMQINVHYGRNFDNAMTNGFALYFGDGKDLFYPLVTIDVLGHEIGHVFVKKHSNLFSNNLWAGEPYALMESFADMSGEASEYYMKGSNDFIMGHDIMKQDLGMRYMYDPPLDGKSIDSVNDFKSGMNPHHSSGVYNKVFYLIATTEGWNTRKAFEIFARANMTCWTPSTGFVNGAECTVESAKELGYPANDVIDAFRAVDIYLDAEPEGVTAQFTHQIDDKTATFTDTSYAEPGSIVSWEWDFGDGTTSMEENPIHTYENYGNYTVTLTVTDDNDLTDTSIVSLNLQLPKSGCSSDPIYSQNNAASSTNIFLIFLPLLSILSIYFVFLFVQWKRKTA